MLMTMQAGPTPAPVLVAFAPPTDQRRSTVALRLILVVPHAVALAVLGAVALVVAVTGWLAALVSGRLPPAVARFLSQYLRWQTRVLAYVFLLTDVYPPFSFDDTAYPVRLTTQPGPLNRGAVALRLLLAVPALLVTAVVTYGTATVVLVITWLVVLVTGRLPAPVHQAYAALVRYTARLQGYLFMVTSQYPWGLLGDLEPGPVPVWQPTPPPPTDDPYWRVVLSASAKNFVVLCLVFGVASVAVANVGTALARYHRFTTDDAASTRVQDAYQSLSDVIVSYPGRTNACDGAPQPYVCLAAAAETVSSAFGVFVNRLTIITMPSPATDDRDVVVTQARHAEQIFEQLAGSTSAGRYELVIETSNLPGILSRFDRDYQDLGTRLNSLR
jgi:hypothetical protein